MGLSRERTLPLDPQAQVTILEREFLEDAAKKGRSLRIEEIFLMKRSIPKDMDEFYPKNLGIDNTVAEMILRIDNFAKGNSRTLLEYEIHRDPVRNDQMDLAIKTVIEYMKKYPNLSLNRLFKSVLLTQEKKT